MTRANSSITVLLAAGANPNNKSSGFSPLHYAIETDDMEMIKALLKAGADTAMTNHTGESPLELARRLKKQHVVDLLKR